MNYFSLELELFPVPFYRRNCFSLFMPIRHFFNQLQKSVNIRNMLQKNLRFTFVVEQFQIKVKGSILLEKVIELKMVHFR